MREEYRIKRDMLVDAFRKIRLPDCTPEATIYLWQKVPQGMTSVDFAKKLLSPEIAIVTTPGAWISDKTANGLNPGEGYVRFALVPSIKDTREAAKRIKEVIAKGVVDIVSVVAAPVQYGSCFHAFSSCFYNKFLNHR